MNCAVAGFEDVMMRGDNHFVYLDEMPRFRMLELTAGAPVRRAGPSIQLRRVSNQTCVTERNPFF